MLQYYITVSGKFFLTLSLHAHLTIVILPVSSTLQKKCKVEEIGILEGQLCKVRRLNIPIVFKSLLKCWTNLAQLHKCPDQRSDEYFGGYSGCVMREPICTSLWHAKPLWVVDQKQCRGQVANGVSSWNIKIVNMYAQIMQLW